MFKSATGSSQSAHDIFSIVINRLSPILHLNLNKYTINIQLCTPFGCPLNEDWMTEIGTHTVYYHVIYS